MNLLLVVLIILILISVGAIPQTGWHSLGYYPSGVGLILIIILLVLLLRP